MLNSEEIDRLRDEFAMAALPQIIAMKRGTGEIETDEVAIVCYQFADSMMIVRDIRNG